MRRSSVVPSKYPEPPLTTGRYFAVALNGDTGCTDTSPLTVIAKLLLLLSLKRLDWQVSRDVPEIAVSGELLVVKAEV